MDKKKLNSQNDWGLRCSKKGKNMFAATQPLLHKDLTEIILGCCFEVMNELGSGFLEKVYKNALFIALQQKGLNVKQEVPIEISFRGKNVGSYFADLLVNDKVIVELKSCSCLLPEHQAQVINYLKAAGLQVGMLVNFGQFKLEYKRLYG